VINGKHFPRNTHRVFRLLNHFQNIEKVANLSPPKDVLSATSFSFKDFAPSQGLCPRPTWSFTPEPRYRLPLALKSPRLPVNVFLILCPVLVSLFNDSGFSTYSSVHCQRQCVSCCGHSSVEQSSVTRHCCPLSPFHLLLSS